MKHGGKQEQTGTNTHKKTEETKHKKEGQTNKKTQ